MLSERCKRCGSYHIDIDYSVSSGKRCMICGTPYNKEETPMPIDIDAEEYEDKYYYLAIECNFDGWLRKRK